MKRRQWQEIEVAAGLLEPGAATSLLDDVLNGRPVDNGEHFLGNGLGRGQKTGTQTGNRDDSFADMFHRGILAHNCKPRLPDRGGT